MTDLATWLLDQIAEDERLALEEDEDYADTTLLPSFDSSHQANWQTRRVLVECTMKRAVLDIHAHRKADHEEEFDFGCRVCATDRDYGLCGEGWCATIRTLTMPYLDRPGSSEEWRP